MLHRHHAVILEQKSLPTFDPSKPLDLRFVGNTIPLNAGPIEEARKMHPRVPFVDWSGLSFRNRVDHRQPPVQFVSIVPKHLPHLKSLHAQLPK